MARVLSILRFTLHTHPRGLTGAPKPPQLGSMSGWTGQAAQSTRLDDPRPSGPPAKPSPASGATPRCHHGQHRELPCVPMLLPCVALRQPSKSAALAASDSLLPRTGCSLRSGCAMDESHGASTHSSTLRVRGRAGKLTWASLSVGRYDTTAPALVRWRVQRRLPVSHPLGAAAAGRLSLSTNAARARRRSLASISQSDSARRALSDRPGLRPCRRTSRA